MPLAQARAGRDEAHQLSLLSGAPSSGSPSPACSWATFPAEPLVVRSLGLLLGGVGVPAEAGVAVGTVLALALATIIQMIFGELYPKNLAISNPRAARARARPLDANLSHRFWLARRVLRQVRKTCCCGRLRIEACSRPRRQCLGRRPAAHHRRFPRQRRLAGRTFR